MRALLKIIAALFGLALIGSAALSVNVWYFKPVSIDLFFNRMFLRYALDDPELLTQIHVLEQYGLDFHSDDLTDVSPEHDARLLERAKDELRTLRSYDRARLDPSRQLSYDTLEWYLQTQVDGAPYLYHDYPMNQLFGVQNQLPTFMVTAHQIHTADDARNYVTRLSKFGWKFVGLLRGLELRESRGIVPPRFVIDKVLAEMRGFTGTPATENILYTNLKDKLDALKKVPEAQRATLLADARREIEQTVYPAYGKLIAYYDDLSRRVTANNGVWALPDGDNFYAWSVKQHTSSNLPPDAIHEYGLAEVERITQEMNTILQAQGYADGTVGERMARLGEDDRFLYANTDAGRSQMLADYQAIIDEVSRGLDPDFDLRPQVGVKVERVPQFKEKTAPGAYYQPPALDKSRPGMFYANLRDVKETPKWAMRTLAYHEAVPGHHFQIGIQQTLPGPIFRKVLPFTAYVEGWALYAERLAWELGFEKNPFDDLGRLQAELFRAARLVVDTGIHRKRWTREQAIDYMRSTTGMAEGDVVAEIERYMVVPGQALAYKIGMKEFLDLREKARQALGPRFDIRKFHNLVLITGPVPLPILERRVSEWIEENR